MFRLNNETQIPEIGLGVYKMEAGKEMNDAVKYAYQSGYRLYDTAQMYKNEQALGDALKENKIPREDIFLISKVNNCIQHHIRFLQIILQILMLPVLLRSFFINNCDRFICNIMVLIYQDRSLYIIDIQMPFQSFCFIFFIQTNI